MMGALPRGERHPAVAAATTWLTRRYRVQFAGAALVQYRDERDSVGFHRDRELRWLDDTLIGVATFGARRPWLMRPIGANRYAVDDDLADAIDLSPVERRHARDGRAQPGRLAARRPEGRRPRPQPHLGAVAVDVEARTSRHEPRLLRTSPLQPLIRRRAGAGTDWVQMRSHVATSAPRKRLGRDPAQFGRARDRTGRTTQALPLPGPLHHLERHERERHRPAADVGRGPSQWTAGRGPIAVRRAPSPHPRTLRR